MSEIETTTDTAGRTEGFGAGDPDPEEPGTLTFSPGELADQVAHARQGLREAHPSCWPDQPDRCRAVLEADAGLEQVEDTLRGLAGGGQPTSGGEAEEAPGDGGEEESEE